MDRLTRDEKEALFKKEITEVFHVVNDGQHKKDFERDEVERELMALIKIAQRDALKCVYHSLELITNYKEREQILKSFDNIIDDLNLNDYVKVNLNHFNERLEFDFNLPKNN